VRSSACMAGSVGFLQHSVFFLLRSQYGTIYSFGCLRSATNGGTFMESSVIKRSVVLAGHKTSVSLEDAFWRGLKDIAYGRRITLSDLVSAIDSERQHGNLSSAIRLFVLDFHRRQLAERYGATHQVVERSTKAVPGHFEA
jgi:predicted DNA-binding ribbon-helix-helix protein